MTNHNRGGHFADDPQRASKIGKKSSERSHLDSASGQHENGHASGHFAEGAENVSEGRRKGKERTHKH